jgi:molecular chaperone GrpE
MNEDSTGQSAPIEPQEAPDTADETEESELEGLRRQAEENWGKYLRVVAELDNLRKRNARELENARKFGAERLAAAILPVRDSLEAALTVGDAVDAAIPDVAAIIEGERATLRLLDQALEGAGVRQLDPEGEPFDPNKHEAISMQPSATAEPNSVLQVIQKGYEIHDRLIRPARVIVAREP